ncbi:hypothetical protein SAMN04487772_109120 [[Clostridium] polysaccharolyticum]|uniref:Uncharacterized protein n=2 Tax=[Clostridium] polysaccharolyticum TaxID=29364 RepID=A0A1I0CD43_9FIRM|nr:hypothetical protein SAMN04487772_109120 [[Clostridium] polysaccharolyticum]
MIYSVSKYGIYENKTEGADVFKLDNWQQNLIFTNDKDRIDKYPQISVAIYDKE